jgi:hypothetical protein
MAESELAGIETKAKLERSKARQVVHEETREYGGDGEPNTRFHRRPV